jgi:hypothetical protein
MAVKFQVEFFCVVMPCGVTVRIAQQGSASQSKNPRLENINVNIVWLKRNAVFVL